MKFQRFSILCDDIIVHKGCLYMVGGHVSYAKNIIMKIEETSH